MTRNAARQIAIQLLFSIEGNPLSADEVVDLFFSEEHYGTLSDEDPAFQERPDSDQMRYILGIVEETSIHLTEIDGVIARYSRGWKKERLSKTTLAILRCAVCEILYMDDVPNSAAVNEAVEFGKKFDSPEAAAFINGLLGSFLRAEITDDTDRGVQ